MHRMITKVKAIELLAQGKVIKIENTEQNIHSYYVMNNDCMLFDLKGEELYSIDEFDNKINKFYY